MQGKDFSTFAIAWRAELRRTVATVLFLVAAAAPGEAAKVTVPQPLELTMAGDSASFLLSSAEGELKNVTVAVKWLEAPDGRLLPPSLLQVEKPDFATVTADGVTIVFRQSPDRLEDAGKYKFTLVVKGDGLAPSRFEGILNRPAPAISFPALDGATIVLHRSWWSASCAGGDRSWDPLPQIQNGQKVHLAVQVRNAESTALAETGRISLTANATLIAKMTLSNFCQTGKFTGKVTMQAGAFIKQLDPTFTVIVTDQPLCPTLAIGLGVGLAIFAKEIAQRLRPRSRIRLRILEISSTLQSFLHRTQDEARLQEIKRLQFDLNIVRQLLASDNFDQAQAKLDEIFEKLGPLHASLEKDRSDAAAARNRVSNLLLQIQGRQATGYANLNASFNQTKELVLQKRYQAAAKQLESLQKAAEDLIATFPPEIPLEPAAVAQEPGGPGEPLEILEERRRIAQLDLGIIGISALVAVVSGIWVLYAGRPFGSAAQYCEAIVWGFGIENTVRGFAAVLNKVEA